MTRKEFEEAVLEAIDGLPPMFKEKLRNIAVIVQDDATPEQLERVHAHGLLFGLYEGVPYSEKSTGFTGQLPDRITIFKNPIEQSCRTRPEILKCVRETVLHEFGHYFGFSDEQLEEMGY